MQVIFNPFFIRSTRSVNLGAILIFSGKYVPALAYKIHKENQLLLNKTFQIPLVGLAMGDAVTDFVSIVGWSEVLYGVGLLDDNQLKIFQDQENMVKEYIRQEKWIDAFEVRVSIKFLVLSNYVFFRNFICLFIRLSIH